MYGNVYLQGVQQREFLEDKQVSREVINKDRDMKLSVLELWAIWMVAYKNVEGRKGWCTRWTRYHSLYHPIGQSTQHREKYMSQYISE